VGASVEVQGGGRKARFGDFVNLWWFCEERVILRWFLLLFCESVIVICVIILVNIWLWIAWLVLWDESTKSYCNLLMRYMRCRKEKKRKEKKRGNGRRVVWGWWCKKHLYQALLPPDTNVSSHLYRKACTGWVLGTNEGYQPVQCLFFQ
jgi:hypothetical protein